MLTYEPLFAVLPSSGLCEITVPSCAEDAFLETLPRFKPFALSVASACSLPKPIILGTDTLSVAGVARKYNLNYGKLIATCKVENISFPSSGYWTKKNMGKDVSNEIVEFSGLEDTEISLITKDAVVKRIRKAKAEVVESAY